jgi:uncharacterized protein
MVTGKGVEDHRLQMGMEFECLMQPRKRANVAARNSKSTYRLEKRARIRKTSNRFPDEDIFCRLVGQSPALARHGDLPAIQFFAVREASLAVSGPWLIAIAVAKWVRRAISYFFHFVTSCSLSMTKNGRACTQRLRRETSARFLGQLRGYMSHATKSTEHELHVVIAADFGLRRHIRDRRVAMIRSYRSCVRGSTLCVTSLALLAGFVFAPRAAQAAREDIPQLQAAAERGLVPQQIELATAYFIGDGVPQDVKLAAHWYEKAAESGDPEAENEIGFLYQTGAGVPFDPERAFHWYQLSAATGYVKAKVNLGVMYVWGIGVRKNEELAVHFFREAFEKGDGTAASYLGDLSYFGIGMKQDRAAAERWYASGAKLHDPIAAYNLGSLFSVQADHPHDFPKAAALLRRSASDGYVPAMHSLGLILVNHPELARSAQEARTLLQTASQAGSWRSTVLLGVLARDGRGAPVDAEAAYYDFQLAVLQGGNAARSLLANDIDALSVRLPAERAAALATSASEWFKQHPAALAFVCKSGETNKRFPALARGLADDEFHAGQLIPPPPA